MALLRRSGRSDAWRDTHLLAGEVGAVRGGGRADTGQRRRLDEIGAIDEDEESCLRAPAAVRMAEPAAFAQLLSRSALDAPTISAAQLAQINDAMGQGRQLLAMLDRLSSLMSRMTDDFQNQAHALSSSAQRCEQLEQELEELEQELDDTQAAAVITAEAAEHIAASATESKTNSNNDSGPSRAGIAAGSGRRRGGGGGSGGAGRDRWNLLHVDMDEDEGDAAGATAEASDVAGGAALREDTGALAGLTAAWQRWAPLQGDADLIGVELGQAARAYAAFHRWSVLTIWLVSLLLPVPFLVIHVRSLIARRSLIGALVYGSSLRGIVPQVFLPSSVGNQNAPLYAALTTLVLAATVALAAEKLVREHQRAERNVAVEAELERVRFSSFLLAGWNHRAAETREGARRLCAANALETVALLEEERVRRAQASLSQLDRLLLLARRLGGGLAYLAIQVWAWAAILELIAATPTIEAALARAGLGLLATSAAPAATVVINTAVPVAIKAITRFERWHKAETSMSMELGRVFLSKLLNALLQVVALLLLPYPTLISGTGSLRELAQRLRFSENASFHCALDQAAAGAAQLVATELVLGKLAPAALPMLKFVVLPERKLDRQPFDAASQAISLLYWLALVFAAAVMAPMLLPGLALCTLLYFRVDVLFMRRFLERPQRPWRTVSAEFVLAVFFGIAVGVLALLFAASLLSRANCSSSQQGSFFDCGMLLPGENPMQLLRESLEVALGTPGVVAVAILRSPLALTAVCLLLLLRVAFGGNALKALLAGVDRRARRWSAALSSAQEQLRRQERVIQRMQRLQQKARPTG
jgi:hypothetical protein